MFAKPALFLAALAAFVVASPSNLCSTGTLQCCNSVEHYTNPDVNDLLVGLDYYGVLDGGLLANGIVNGVAGNVGLKCTQLIGSSNECETQVACCKSVHFKSSKLGLGCDTVSVGVL
ncbi:hypothetical protein ONZ45_g8075 [Pleurotus djamor]|nr:hypothetical protein ONZ45_g8075 [Pleurotus djamor]